MIHLINSENRPLYEAALSQMHSDRTRYFVEGRGWSDLKVEGGREYDEYDTDDAIYLIGFDTDGTIGVSLRLLPADNGCILSDHFSHLVPDGELSGPGVYEISRYYASPRRRGPAGFALRSALHVATLEAAIERGARRLLGLTDLGLLNLMRYTGWRVQPLGTPSRYAEGVAAAFEVGCSESDLAHTRQLLDLPGRQLFCAPAWLPRGADVGAIADMTDLVINAPPAIAHSVKAEVDSRRGTWGPQGDIASLIDRLRNDAPA